MKTLTKLKYSVLAAVFVMNSYIYLTFQSQTPEELSATSADASHGLSTATESVNFSTKPSDGANAQLESLIEQRQTSEASIKDQRLTLENSPYDLLHKTPDQRRQKVEDAFSAREAVQLTYDMQHSDFLAKLKLSSQDHRTVKGAMTAIDAHNIELVKLWQNGELSMEKLTEQVRGYEELDKKLGLLTSAEVKALNDRELEFITQVQAEAAQSWDTRHGQGNTPLMDSSKFEAVSAVDFLIAEGADISAVYRENGSTALMGAAYYGNADNVQALIDAGADVNTQDNSGNTPLMRAVRGNVNVKTLEILIDAGADVNTTNNFGSSPLDWARRIGHQGVIDVLLAAN